MDKGLLDSDQPHRESVNPEQEKSLREVFLQAAEIEDDQARAAYLNHACGGDVAFRQRIDRLLAADRDIGAPPGSMSFTAIRDGDLMDATIGPYKLLQQIGEGGCGVVFMAAQEEPVRRKVALKIIKLGMDTKQVVARFEAERQALAMMDHPNIAHVFDAGATDAGRPYFVMELVRGAKITDYCDEHQLSTPQRLNLFTQVCHAVQHAHQKGIIHRDLKPSNVLVTEVDGKPTPKIIDFGIAKAIEGRLTDHTMFTAFEQLIGTPSYMSPEQASLATADIDTRTDIYSLGVMLYQLLTGETPFDTKALLASGLDEMRRTINKRVPVRPSNRLTTMAPDQIKAAARARGSEPSKLMHSLADDLDWIVMKCLEKDRGRRYAAANALAMDIQRCMNSEPIVARPPSRLYEFRKTVIRHKFGFAATAVVILVLAAGLAGVFWQWRRAAAAEQQTLKERDQAEFLAAESAMEKGQSKLETGNSWGLFDLAEAYGLAKHAPALQEAIGRLWSTWHIEWDRRTIAVRRRSGIPTPDHLQTMTLTDWPPLNTSRVVEVIETLIGTRTAGPLMHESNAKAGAFSPDGRLLAIVTENGVIHLWDRITGKAVHVPCETGIPNLNSVSFSPDGRFLVAYRRSIKTPGSKRAAVLRLDESGGRAHFLEKHRYPIGDARFSPDGESLAVLCKPDLQLWRTADFQPMGSPIAVGLSDLLEFNLDGTLLAFNQVGSGGIGLLNPRTREIVRSLATQFDGPRTASFSHDGSLLAVFRHDLSISLWRTQDSATEPYATQRIGRRSHGRLSFNRDDSLLAMGDSAGLIHVVSTGDGHTIQTLHAFPSAGPHFLTNGVLAASGGNAAFWDLSAEPLPWSALPNDALANALAFDRSGAVLAVGGEDELRFWWIDDSPHRGGVVAMPGRVLALTFSESEGRFVAFSDDGSLTQVEPRTGQTNQVRRIDRGGELSACLSPDARKLALYRYDEAFVVDTQTGAFHWLENEGGYLSVAFRDDSQKMAMGAASFVVCSYDVSGGTPRHLERSQHLGGWVYGVAYHPDGKLIAVNVEGRVIQFYDPGNDRHVLDAYEPSLAGVELLCFSPNGSLLATAGPRSGGGYGIEICHVDLQRGLFRGASILSCEHEIRSMVFSPDNRTLVTGGFGATRLWHVPPAPKSLEEVQSRTWRTLGIRLDEQGNPVFPVPATDGVENIRARLTQEPVTSISPLDAALMLPPVEALPALQALAAQHPEATVFRELQGRLHADLVVTNAERGEWKKALEHANEAVHLGCDDPLTQAFCALLFAQVGDIVGYRRSCKAMAERYKSCDDPAVIRLLTEVVSLLPGALDDYDELIEHVRRSILLVGGRDAPAYRFFLGAVLAAAGRYEYATTELERVNQYVEANGAPGVFDPIELKFLLATCQAHLDYKDAAREWFADAVTETESVFRPDQGTAHVHWYLRPLIDLRRKDAEAALGTPTPQPARVE